MQQASSGSNYLTSNDSRLHLTMLRYYMITTNGRLQVELSGLPREEMIKTPAIPEIIVLRAEKDIRLRIDLLEGQSSFIAKMLTRAISEHNEVVFAEYAKRLAVSRGGIEELLWVLGEKNTTTSGGAAPAAAAAGGGQSVLDVRVASKNSEITVSVREVIEKLRRGELRMDELSADTQTIVRKGALEMKNKNRR